MPKKTRKYDELFSVLGYKFVKQEWLSEALTRQDAVEEKVVGAAKRNYQRLEFLGDRVLNFSALLLLLSKYPNATEGELISLCEKLIANDALLPMLGKQLELNKYLICGKGQATVTDKMYADAVEAILGAVCMDSNFLTANKIATKLLLPYLAVLNGEMIKRTLVDADQYEAPNPPKKKKDPFNLDEFFFELSSASVGLKADSANHFDSGNYVFRKIVLSWSLDEVRRPLSEISYCEPLPAKRETANARCYYQSFKPLILEEARASLAAGIELVELKKIKPMKLALTQCKKARNIENPSSLDFSGQINLDDDCRGSTVGVLLRYSFNKESFELLALAEFQEQQPDQPATAQRFLKVKVILPEEGEWLEKGLKKGAKWHGYLLGSLVTQMRMYDVCTRQSKFDYLCEIITGRLPIRKASLFSRVDSLAGTDFSILNDSQAQAVKNFLVHHNKLHLLQGPPGTGKTTTIIFLLEQLVKSGQRVMVCAPSNKAVQVIAERLLVTYPGIAMALVGVPSKLSPELSGIFIHGFGNRQLSKLRNLEKIFKKILHNIEEDKIKLIDSFSEIQVAIENGLSLLKFLKIHLPSLSEIKFTQFSTAARKIIEQQTHFFKNAKFSLDEFISLISELLSILQLSIDRVSTLQVRVGGKHSKTIRLEQKLVQDAAVVFSTLSVAGRKFFDDLDGEGFDVLIIDEAGQATEVQTLAPMRFAKKCLLVGDPDQLPATVVSVEADKRHFSRSLLGRLIKDCGQPHDILTIQYRMHPDIRLWPSSQFYNDVLSDAPSVGLRTTRSTDFYQSPIIMPCVLFDIAGKESLDGRSYVNQSEASYVVRLLSLFHARGIDIAQQVGVITFYSGQVSFLNAQLRKLPEACRNVKISTVDSFQGDERDIIIISFVRANTKGKTGFVKAYQRLNVALTRPKLSLIMLGNVDTLEYKRSDLYDLCQNLKERKLVFTKQVLDSHLPQSIFTKKTAACRFFAKGNCRYDERCHFLHEKTAQETKDASIQSSKLKNPHQSLFAALGHQFRQISYLIEALTRQTAIEEQLAQAANKNNGKLMLVGDRALKLVLAIMLFDKFKASVSEGILHAAEKNLIQQERLAAIGERQLLLEKHLIRGEGEQVMTQKMYADTVKSVLGAVYSDANSVSKLFPVVSELYDTAIDDVVGELNPAI